MYFTDSFKEFLYWEKTSRDTIDFKKIYVDITGDILAGLLLSQIVYWYLPNEYGKSKLRVYKDGYYWIAKTQKEWYEEIRFSRKNLETAVKKLCDLSIVEKKVYKFDGAPTVHLRLIEENFLPLWLEQIRLSMDRDEQKADNSLPRMDLPESGKSKSPNRANRNDRIGQIEMTESGKSFLPNQTNQYVHNGQLDLPHSDISLTKTTAENTTESTTYLIDWMGAAQSAAAHENSSVDNINDQIYRKLVQVVPASCYNITGKPLEQFEIDQIYTMLLKQFPYSLDPQIVHAACRIYFERTASFDLATGRIEVKVNVENPVGFFKHCYEAAIEQYRASVRANTLINGR